MIFELMSRSDRKRYQHPQAQKRDHQVDETLRLRRLAMLTTNHDSRLKIALAEAELKCHAQVSRAIRIQYYSSMQRADSTWVQLAMELLTFEFPASPSALKRGSSVATQVA